MQDAERLARFRREAQVLASLNHPHIAAIYGLESAGGVSALALELVEGEDLSVRLARGPMGADAGAVEGPTAFSIVPKVVANGGDAVGNYVDGGPPPINSGSAPIVPMEPIPLI